MKISILSVTLLLAVQTVSGQQQPEAWSLSKCINQALTGNLQLKQAALATGITQVNREQALASRFPVVEATARQSFAWSDQLNNDGTYDFTGSNSSSASISSSATLFNGFRKENTIKQSQLNYQSAVLDEEAYRQDITLQVLDSYLQVLYAGELVEVASREAFFSRPRHPYTQALFEALPDISRRGQRLTTIPGQVPSLAAMPAGCQIWRA